MTIYEGSAWQGLKYGIDLDEVNREIRSLAQSIWDIYGIELDATARLIDAEEAEIEVAIDGRHLGYVYSISELEKLIMTATGMKEW